MKDRQVIRTVFISFIRPRYSANYDIVYAPEKNDRTNVDSSNHKYRDIDMSSDKKKKVSQVLITLAKPNYTSIITCVDN